MKNSWCIAAAFPWAHLLLSASDPRAVADTALSLALQSHAPNACGRPVGIAPDFRVMWQLISLRIWL